MTFAPLRRVLLVALVLPALALAACGSDDKDTTTAAVTAAATTPVAPAGPLDEVALAEAANAICKATNDQGDALNAPPPNADNDHVAAYYEKLAALTATQQQQLEALTPAASAKAQFAKFTGLTRQATDLVKDIGPAVKVDGGSKAAALMQRVQDLSPQINAAADGLGARICGSDSGKS